MYSVSPGQPPVHGAHHRSLSYRTNRADSNPYVQSNDDRTREEEIAKVRRYMFGKIYDCVWQLRSQYYGIQAERVHQLTGHLEEILLETAVSQEEYRNLETLSSRAEVHLQRLSQHRQRSLQCNQASTSIMEPTSNRLQYTPFRRFPNQMIPEYSTAASCNQSNMIPTSSPLCNGTSMTDSEAISELHAYPKPAQAPSIGGQNHLMMQSASFINSTGVSFTSRDQTVQFLNDSVNSDLRNMESNMIHANGPDISGTKLFQTECIEPEQLLAGQHRQTGDRHELCSTAPPVRENHNVSTSSLVRVKSDCSSSVLSMHTQWQSNLRSNLMPSYLRLPHPDEAMAIQRKVNQSGNGNSSSPVNDTLWQFRGYDVRLDSQYQPQQYNAAGMLETTAGGNSHMEVDEISCRNHAESLNQPESQHLANGVAPPVQVSHIDQLSQHSESNYRYVNTGIQPNAASCSLHVAAEKLDTSSLPCLQVGSNNNFNSRETRLKIVSEEGSFGINREPTLSRDATCTSKDFNAESSIKKTRQSILLGLCHAQSCNLSTAGKCPLRNCMGYKKLLQHIVQCRGVSCASPQCSLAKTMITHYRQCKDHGCPLCVPVKIYLIKLKKSLGTPSGRNHGQHPTKRVKTDVLEACIPTSEKPFSGVSTDCTSHSAERPTVSDAQSELGPLAKPELKSKLSLGTPSGMNHGQCNAMIMSKIQTYEDLIHPPKRVKTEVQEVCIPTTEKPRSCVSTDCTPHSVERPINSDAQPQYELGPPAKPELKKPDGSSHEDPSLASCRDSKIDRWPPDGTSVDALENITHKSIKHEELLQTSTKHARFLADPVTESMECLKVNCASLIELFTPEQVRQHIRSLQQWPSQGKANADKKQSMEQSGSQNSCQLCAAEELNFEPRPIYCTQCCSRIKRQAVYYMLGTGGTCYCFCKACHTAIPKENSVVYGVTFSKSELEKRKNNDHIQEPWVQCDKCQGWQHQICALFNSRMNGEGQAKYTCPNCYVKEIERGDREALPQTAFRGAKDLPRTALSDHIERRLGRTLAEGQVDEKVRGHLVVRVVLSVDKTLKVKKKFLEIFQGHDYPAGFPYKSKVILMFQNIEGVEVCLFGMYVQEYGSECDFPNRRCVYISYLDSLKYFRPDVKLLNGERLRTFIYHEVLIGYLEYCKIRGFTSCYIWVCPPPKDEDYILYCHPESQRTPKKDKLKEWYLSMLKKAMSEDIVVEIGNLYNNFLDSSDESKAKITAAKLPYFDGDYWPGIAEEKLQRLCEEGEKAPSKKIATKKPLPKRSLRTSLHSDISDSASKDTFLIHEIRKIMYPVKEDFIMVHLQHACAHCCMFIISGNCWQCEQCSSFRLCDRCYEAEQCLDDRDRHPLKKPFRHSVHPVEILNVPSDTKDVDGIIESDIFDSRYSFLSLCQGNNYQNDTLRRAKHSSMMLLYHLHNSTAPAFVTPCNVCHLDIEPGRGLICEVCFDYQACSRCYERLGDSDHPHKLTKHYSSHRMKETRAQVKKMNDLIVHVSDCHSPSCTYVDCCKVKWLFHHRKQCTKRALKGCATCKKMWYLLLIHSRNCLALKCRVPRCSDLKMHKRRLHQQLESQRRAAVTEMSMQRIAKANAES